jgi:2-keto-4-pentenoate hydratase/2-oxohepta-3-ene-1,7-dioic acid hydratase in catechol pathway
MKIFRFGTAGAEKPGVILPGGGRIDVSAFGEDYDETFFGDDGLSRLRAWLATNQGRCPPVDDQARLGPAVCRPSKIVCMGLNYREHAREQGVEPPKEVAIFLKATTALCGPNDDMVLPRGSVKSDWEVELALVIGKRARYVTRERAPDHVAGFVLHNDYSEREYQMERGGQWDKGKGCDTFAPLGPFLATPEEVDCNNLGLWLDLNGQRVQTGNTSDMIFDVATLISYTSQFMTLLPGDVISTGTPPGVGCFAKPPRFLRAGDVVDLGIDGLGQSRQRVVSEA